MALARGSSHYLLKYTYKYNFYIKGGNFMNLEDTISLSTLPPSILNQFPLSIRTLRDEYKLKDLPPNLQALVEEYIDNSQSVKYGTILGFKPEISEYGDLKVIKTNKDLFLEYLKNYLTCSPGDYPWDPSIGCKLKKYLMTLDTSLQGTLINNEVETIVRMISEELGISASVNFVNVNKSSTTGMEVIYNINLSVKINGQDSSVQVSIS